MELRSIQTSPDWEISKSSLPMDWPLIKMRNFPLSGENAEGAPAGFAVIAEAAGEEAGAKTRRLKPALPGRASNIPAASGKASAPAQRRIRKCLSRFMTTVLQV